MPLPSEWVHRTTDLKWSTNTHGDESCQATLDVTADEAVDIIANNRVDPVEIYSPLGEPLYRGRLDDPTLALGEEGAFSFASMGGWAAMNDLEQSYTAAWSQRGFGNWREATKTELSTVMHERFEIKINDKILISPRKNETHGGNIRAYVVSSVPDDSRKNWAYCAFSYSYKLPASWEWALLGYNADWSLSSVIAGAFAGTGAVVNGAITGGFTAAARFVIYVRYNAANAVYAGETGDDYLELSEMRLTVSSDDAISTTLTATRSNATPATLTVGSTARMYVGQYLTLSGGGKSEQAIVTAVNSSTSVTVDSVTNSPAPYPIGTLVLAPIIYGDEVAADVALFVNSVNADQLAAGGSLSAMSLDLVDAVYEDATPSEILNDLCNKSGDGTVWETGVDAGILYLRPRGQRAQAWMIDVEAITLTTSLADLVNSAYAVYEDTNGDTIRSAVSADTASVTEHGVTRRRSISVKASSAVQAQAEVDALLDDKALLGARATIPNITALYDLYGTRWPLWEANAGRGDTITIRNVSPEVASGLEARLTFRLSRTTYDAKADTLTVELEAPRPGL